MAFGAHGTSNSWCEPEVVPIELAAARQKLGKGRASQNLSFPNFQNPSTWNSRDSAPTEKGSAGMYQQQEFRFHMCPPCGDCSIGDQLR